MTIQLTILLISKVINTFVRTKFYNSTFLKGYSDGDI